MLAAIHFISNVIHPRQKPRAPRPPRRSFSLVELLVVIAIIVILVGLLFVALRQVNIRAKRTRTENVMLQFANACVAFQAEHGFYPGVIPEHVLAGTTGTLELSSTENALLQLMGGYRVKTPQDPDGGAVHLEYLSFLSAAQGNTPPSHVEIPFDFNNQHYDLAIDLRKIGEGPVINGKPYAPYFTPSGGDLVVCTYPHGTGPDPTNQIPDLVDAWGQPILYVRQVRDRGPLLPDAAAAMSPQFLAGGPVAPFVTIDQAGSNHYVLSTSLAELGRDQTGPVGSILNLGAPIDINNAWAVVLSHASFYKNTTPLYGAARGAFALISAGPDGIYFSAVDGPGNEGDPLDPADMDAKFIDPGPKILQEFDDIVIFSGG